MKELMIGLVLILLVGSVFAFEPFRVHTIGIDATVYAEENNAGSIGIFIQKWLFWGGTGLSSGDKFLGVYGELGFILPFINGLIIIPTGRLIFGGQQDKFDEIEYDLRSGMGISFEINTQWGTIIPGLELRGLQDAGLVIGGRLSVPF